MRGKQVYKLASARRTTHSLHTHHFGGHQNIISRCTSQPPSSSARAAMIQTLTISRLRNISGALSGRYLAKAVGSCLASAGASAQRMQERFGGARSQSWRLAGWCPAARAQRGRRPSTRLQGHKIRSGCQRTCQRHPSARGLVLSNTRKVLQNSHFESVR
jgi:hypothetical protein